MTLAQLEKTLPNGFHDAKLLGANVHDQSGLAILRMRLLTSLPPEGSEKEVIEYTLAAIHLSGVSMFVAPDEIFNNSPSQLDVQGFVPDEQHWPQIMNLDDESKRLAYSFYVHDWNTSIHIVASEATLSW